jgi:hypothetical protein
MLQTSSIDSGKPISMHGSTSPEAVRPSLSGMKSRNSQLYYQSPQDGTNPYSPITNRSSNYSGSVSANGADNYAQGNGLKRTNSDNFSMGHESATSTPGGRPQRHTSFGVSDSKPVEFSRPPVQTAMGQYGLVNASNNQNYHSTQASPQTYVSQQNFPAFSLPPPTFSPAPTSAPLREPDPVYPTSMSTDYPNEGIQHQQSGPDMMLLDQMTAPNTMPVFGGEGYNRSPFAIPEDFVAYLFSNNQMDTSSPMGQMGQQAYAKSVILVPYSKFTFH